MAVLTNDAYAWVVIYRDGGTLPEFEGAEIRGRGFGEVEAGQVAEVQLTGRRNPYLVHRVAVPEGGSPVFFRRRKKTVNLVEERVQAWGTVHCIGWQREDEAVYLFVFSDGSTLLTDDLQAV